MTQHTPGPWTVNNESVEGKGRIICTMYRAMGHEGAPIGERLSNANFIAAAPGVLQALKDIVEDIEDVAHEAHDWSQHVVVKQARAAIAKATE